ncbi:MAG: ABC-F family ATP-binding cassette domain-containing protein [Sporolactobacillus sp.]
MILLQAQSISKSFAAEPILTKISLEVQSGEHVALVGRNGAGKSTLLKIIAGLISADSGEIMIPKGQKVGYLPQNATLNSEKAIYDELLSVFEPLVNMENRLHVLEKQLSEVPDSQQLLTTYDALLADFKIKGGYTYRADIRSVLSGLKFDEGADSRPVCNLSGGQKTQLALGKILLLKPDLLILDEPTNHLDIDTLTWLEGYLQHYAGGMLIVSHDRYFLDKVVTKVYEISGHAAKKYSGNYTRYLQLREADYEQALKNYEKQQKEIGRLNDFVQKNIVRASTTKRAQSRRKQLEKIERIEKPRGDERAAVFSFTTARQSGRDVLDVTDLAVGHNGSPIISRLNFRIARGERVAIVGPNGTGKSTVLKAIVDDGTRISGSIRLGSQVSIGYYDQEQTGLNVEKTVLNELWDDYPLQTENEIRSILGRFLFSGGEVAKPVGALSGGEKARLLLAKLMMRQDNLLILDEPTNHLDIDSKEVLEAVLADFSGTILFVSHDRYFINRIAGRILELSRAGIQEYLGDYDYYVDKKSEQRELALLEQQAAPMQKQAQADPETAGLQQFRQTKEQKKEKRRLERDIERFEQEISRLEAAIAADQQTLADPAVYSDMKKATEAQEALNAHEQALSEMMNQWEKAQLRAEQL